MYGGKMKIERKQKGKSINSITIIFLITLMLLSSTLFSYEKRDDLRNTLTKKNVMDVTLGGTGLFISANYSRLFILKSNLFLNASTGIGSVPFIGGISVPIQLTCNLGTGKNFFEFGLGGSIWSGKSNASGYKESIDSYNISPIIGWRRNLHYGFVFRSYVNPLIRVSGEYFLEDYSIIPYLGVNLGYSF